MSGAGGKRNGSFRALTEQKRTPVQLLAATTVRPSKPFSYARRTSASRQCRPFETHSSAPVSGRCKASAIRSGRRRPPGSSTRSKGRCQRDLKIGQLCKLGHHISRSAVSIQLHENLEQSAAVCLMPQYVQTCPNLHRVLRNACNRLAMFTSKRPHQTTGCLVLR
jgi:hypothetical protein